MLFAVTRSARAQPGIDERSETTGDAADEAIAAAAPSDMSDQAIGASLGLSTGGRVTAGGLRVAGRFLYQLAEQDWFDGVAAFTFGGGEAACFRDRMDVFLCDHGLADGYAIEVTAGVRRFLGGRGDFWPFVRVGLGLALVRFPADDVSGLAIPVHGGAGLRATVADGIAVTAEASLGIGFGWFSRSLGLEPQLGASISAGAEFRL
jgi:hypothetical protein